VVTKAVETMSPISIHLFGEFSASRDGRLISDFHSAKARELLCYLLLYRDRRHLRDQLAGLLWADSPGAQAKKYLRQALWHLQDALESADGTASASLLVVDDERLSLRPGGAATLDLDVAAFEQAYALVRGVPGAAFSVEVAGVVERAVDLYQGDLLEGWWQDWCIFERERLQLAYLAMLDRLMGYHEAHRRFDAGVAFGLRALSLDRAQERTHRRLMRLHYLSGNRSEALRQYAHCVAALREELDVDPDRLTVSLYHEIKADRLQPPASRELPVAVSDSGLADLVAQLRRLEDTLADLRGQIDESVIALELALNGEA
jgi:DNA-binding SARP family transcriptional activator